MMCAFIGFLARTPRRRFESDHPHQLPPAPLLRRWRERAIPLIRRAGDETRAV
jgi:hypothetical protein